MFEIIMLAGFLIAGISQLIPVPKKHSKPDTGATSTRNSSNKTQAGSAQYIRRQCTDNHGATYRQIKAA